MSEELFVARVMTPDFCFTEGIEGPACDAEGSLYAVNFERQGTIGRLTPKGACSVFLELPNGSIGNGIRFDSKGFMYIADYTNHNILKVDMQNRRVSVYVHEALMNQPNDIAISSDDIIYASDPNWLDNTGQLWRIDKNGIATCMEKQMGTTNGIEISPDESILYANESVQRRIWAYDLCAKTGICNKRLLIEFPDYGLDGMRCDMDGNIYVTRFGKGTVVKLSPEGKVLMEIELGGRNCTNVAFGGEDGRSCFVTVSDKGHVEMFRTDIPGREWMMLGKRRK